MIGRPPRAEEAAKVTAIRLTAVELRKISQAASARGLTVSEFVRRAALSVANDLQVESQAPALF